MEDEVRHILRTAVKDDRLEVARLGSRIAKRFRSVGLSENLPELHGQTARGADFGK